MNAEEVEAYFTRSEGGYKFARWARPMAPIVFGVDDATLPVVKGAVQAVAALAGIEVSETDPELGSNLMFFFFSDWEELLEVPNLDKLVPNLSSMVAQLAAAEANQYRLFRFEKSGGIKACFVFLRMDAVFSELPAETLCLTQVVQSILLWSDHAFLSQSPLAILPDGRAVLRPEIGNLIRASYDPTLPELAEDKSHALRVFARLSQMSVQ
ncbi:MAG: hypothetical protein CMG98_13285 [Marinovum sp.]|nr:hypothetical protein [Marinovum sp.]